MIKPTEPTTYTVSYDANGGTGAPESQTKTKNVKLVLSSTEPTREGFTFEGWATTSTGEAVYLAGDDYEENTDVTLYAIWEAIPGQEQN